MEKNDFKLNFLHVCDFASFSEGGKLNVLGIFENINTPNIPYVHPQMFVVSNISINKIGNYRKVITKFINEGDNSEIIKTELQMNVDKSDKGEFKMGSVGQLNGVKFEEYGKYKIQIFIDENMVGEKEITISKFKN